MPPIPLAVPILGNEEKEALSSVVDSGWITMGDRVRAFEEAFARMHGADDAVAVNSCTAGLHLCLAALGIGPGDEVLVPSLTFVATVNAVVYTGATPVFVDIERVDSPHMALTDASAKITHRTRAVMIMHYGGYGMDTGAWRAFADAAGLRLIEDAAHAPGADAVGRYGDASAFSFFTNKNMTTAEGGMVLARDLAVRERIRTMRSHGMTTGTLDRDRGHAFSYDVISLGYNYRMDELRAALGLVQLARLRDWNARRRELSRYYRRLLATHIPEIVVPFSADHETVSHLMPIVLPEHVDRERLMTSLRQQQGIQTSIHYPPVHGFTWYRGHFPGVVLPQTEAFARRALSLPLYPELREPEVDQVVSALKEGMSA